MKKHTILFLLVQFFWVGTAFSQDLEIEWGTDFDSKTEIQKILGYSGESMVAYSLKGKKRYIETYEKAGFRLDNTAEFELPLIGGKKSGLLNIALSGDKVAALLYVYERKTKAFTLYSQMLTINGKVIGTTSEIYSSAGGDDKIKDRKVSVAFSPDNSKAVVYFDRKNKERTEFYTDIVVVDLANDLEVIGESEHEFDIRDSKSEKINFKVMHSVENDGTFSMIQEKLELEKRKIIDFRLTVGRYKIDGSEIGVANISEAGRLFVSPTMVVNEGKTYVVGYYIENEKGRQYVSGYNGLFMASFNENMELQELKTNDFTNDFLKNVYRGKKVDRAADKGKELRVPAPYTMNEIIVHSDGTLTVLSEYYLVTVTENRGQRTTTTNFGSILYFKLDTEGNLIAADAIKKNQISSTTSIGLAVTTGIGIFISIELPDKKAKYWSYASLVNNDNVYLVFNDHFKNASDGGDDLSKPMTNPKKAVPYLVTIDPEGDFTKEAMVDSGDSETYLVPQVTYQTGPSEFVIWGIRRKLNKFGLGQIK